MRSLLPHPIAERFTAEAIRKAVRTCKNSTGIGVDGVLFSEIVNAPREAMFRARRWCSWGGHTVGDV